MNEINLRRFLAWPELDLVLNTPIAAFVGANGTGKSSILDAVKVILSRTARGAPKGDLSRLTTWGMKPFRLEAVVGKFDEDGDFLGSKIRRTATTLSVIDDEGTAITLGEGKLVSNLTRHPKALEAVFDVWKALRMSPDDRRALILDLAGDHVQTVTDARLLAWGLTDDSLRELALAGNWKKASATAADVRRSTQSNLDALDLSEIQDPLVGEDDGIPASDVDDAILEDQRKALGDLRTERRQLDERIGAVKAAPTPKPKADPRPALQALVAARQEAIDLVNVGELVKRAGELSGQILALGAKVAALEKVRDEAESTAQAAGESADAATKALGDAEARRGRHACTICGLEHEASDAPSVDQLKALEQTMAKATEEGDDAQGALDKAGQEKDNIARWLTTAQTDMKAAEDALADFEKLERERNKARDKLAELEAAPVDPQDAPEPVEDLDHLTARRDALDARIRRGAAMIRTVDDYRKASGDLAQRKRKASRLEQRVVDLGAQEDLCRPDKPGNIPGRLLADVLQPIRERLARWTGSALWTSELARDGLQINGVDLDDAFSPVVVDTAGDRHPIGTVNAGAEWRVGFALAASLADLSGLRFLALDEVTYLDGDNRAGLVSALLEVREDFDQVLICAVQSGEVIQPPIDAVQFYYLDGKTAEPLGVGEIRG